MDINKLSEKLKLLFKKYKFVLLILGIGMLLMWLPGLSESSRSKEVPVQTVAENLDISEKLEDMLRDMEGVGDVRVMLTVKSGAETKYQTDIDKDLSEKSDGTKEETIIITDSERNELGLIKQIISPIYQGAIVICQGADSPVVRLMITEAVSKLTGLGADQIAILKME